MSIDLSMSMISTAHYQCGKCFYLLTEVCTHYHIKYYVGIRIIPQKLVARVSQYNINKSCLYYIDRPCQLIPVDNNTNRCAFNLSFTRIWRILTSYNSAQRYLCTCWRIWTTDRELGQFGWRIQTTNKFMYQLFM